MVLYECETCGKNFQRKSNYISHLNRKIQCTPILVENQVATANVDVSNSLQCQYCKETFTRKDSLKRHVDNRCKLKIKFEVEKLKQEIIEIKEKNNKTENITTNTSNINGNNNHVNNTTNNTTTNYNTKLVAFGDEDLSFIADSVYKKIFNDGLNSVPKLVEYIHLNKDKPENMNIHLSNLKDQYLSIFDGEDWNVEIKNNLLDDMYYKNADALEKKFKELDKELGSDVIKKFKRFIDNVDDDETMKNVVMALKLILYR
jgi:uncharacterized C2H2 Zn-finger protein